MRVSWRDLCFWEHRCEGWVCGPRCGHRTGDGGSAQIFLGCRQVWMGLAWAGTWGRLSQVEAGGIV